ncbi:hypothetical protein [Rhodococcus sp. KRD162]|uniref:hypothetical protein n=1 Tax=Rhodococcus sp. KRD162 TaxID=2729725 RepID=UPI0019D10021|nr:hypothetical protein [Rhodococcus sp. KRD162]
MLDESDTVSIVGIERLTREVGAGMTDDADRLFRRYDKWWTALSPDDRAHVEQCCETGRTDERLCALILENDGPSKAAFEVGSKLSEGNSKYCAIPSALLEFLESKRAHPPR